MPPTPSLPTRGRGPRFGWGQSQIGWVGGWHGWLLQKRLPSPAWGGVGGGGQPGGTMSDLLHLNLANAFLPLTLLIMLAIGLPALLAGPTRSHWRLALVMVGTGLVVWAVGAGLMAWLYAQVNGGAFGGIGFYLGRSGMMALLWGPVLALVWLMRAQGVERRRGLLMRGGGDEAAD